jgi:hypothetical protein
VLIVSLFSLSCNSHFLGIVLTFLWDTDFLLFEAYNDEKIIQPRVFIDEDDQVVYSYFSDLR